MALRQISRSKQPEMAQRGFDRFPFGRRTRRGAHVEIGAIGRLATGQSITGLHMRYPARLWLETVLASHPVL